MSNRYDSFYGYTGLFPIIDDLQAESHLDILREVLMSLPDGRGSLFSRTGLVHGARLFIIDDPVYNGRPSREEHFAYAYLALSITFDGELEALAERIAAVGAEAFTSVFSHCYGFGGASSAGAVLSYLKACQIETTFLYVDSDVDLPGTLSALAAQRRIADMIERAQGCGPAERKALVRDLAERLQLSPAPEPGDFVTSNDRDL
ncbi:MAG: hypothetical protein JWN93_3039 [Hyphomicrobiales bacterium]|nr:hypothetical protein [Hyphomicrobiales bacterium]